MTDLEQDDNQRMSEKKLNKYENVILETLETEKSFIEDLKSIVIHYEEFFELFNEQHLFSSLKFSLENILEFALQNFISFNEHKSDPCKFCQVFTDRSQTFEKRFGSYCELFPLATALLENMSPTCDLAQLINKCRKESNQLLPLSSYLLKPVQRILKYHLLLQTIASDKSADSDLKNVANCAVLKMKYVADMINEKQRLQDGYTQLPLLRRKIINLTEPLSVIDVGPVVLQETMLVNKDLRRVILFENIFIICVILENELYAVKDALTPNDIVLMERKEKNEMLFTIHSQKNSKNKYQIKAKNVQAKTQWVLHIKRLILKNLGVKLDQKRLEAMFGKEDTEKILCLNSVHNLQNIEETISKMDIEKNDNDNDQTLKGNTKLSQLIQKQKKFDLKKIIEKVNDEKSDVVKKPNINSHNDNDKTVNTAADVIEVFNQSHANESESTQIPFSQDILNDAAKEIQDILKDDSDKFSSKSTEESQNIIDKHYSTPLALKSINNNKNSSSKNKRVLDDINIIKEQNVKTIKQENKKFFSGKISFTSNITQSSSETSNFSSRTSISSKADDDNNQLQKNIKNSVFKGSQDSLLKEEKSQSSKDKITIPTDVTKISENHNESSQEVPKNIVQSIVGILNNYNTNNETNISSSNNKVCIQKASKISDILLKLQQNYMESQKKFKQNVEPIKIGKKGIPLDSILQDNNEK